MLKSDWESSFPWFAWRWLCLGPLVSLSASDHVCSPAKRTLRREEWITPVFVAVHIECDPERDIRAHTVGYKIGEGAITCVVHGVFGQLDTWVSRE